MRVVGAAVALSAVLFASLPLESGQAAEPLHPPIVLDRAGRVTLQVEGDGAPEDGEAAAPADPAEGSSPIEALVPEPTSPNAIAEQSAGEATSRPSPAPDPPVAPVRPKVGVGRYTVVQGDTMFSIARRVELSLQALAAANGIADPNTVKAGQVLYVPALPGSVHVVGKDETLKSIVDQYQVKTDDVREANGLDKEARLSAGQLLVIPGVMRAALAEVQPVSNSMNASVFPAASGSPTPTPTSTPAAKSSQPAATTGGSGPRPPVSDTSGTMIWSVVGPISTPYVASHRGLDIVASQGTSVKAALAGRVIAAQEWDGPYGWYVIVQHGGDFTTVYAHLSKIRVKEGDTVTQGQVVGEVGTTGQSTGPHLHFELRKSNLPIDPRQYLP